MVSLDRKLKSVQNLQKWLDHRTKIEDQAIALTVQCRFEEARKLLAELSLLPVPE